MTASDDSSPDIPPNKLADLEGATALRAEKFFDLDFPDKARAIIADYGQAIEWINQADDNFANGSPNASKPNADLQIFMTFVSVGKAIAKADSNVALQEIDVLGLLYHHFPLTANSRETVFANNLMPTQEDYRGLVAAEVTTTSNNEHDMSQQISFRPVPVRALEAYDQYSDESSAQALKEMLWEFAGIVTKADGNVDFVEKEYMHKLHGFIFGDIPAKEDLSAGYLDDNKKEFLHKLHEQIFGNLPGKDDF